MTLPGENQPIRVAIAAPVLSMRLGLAAMLNIDDRIEVVASAANLHDMDVTQQNSDVLLIAGAAANLNEIAAYQGVNPTESALPAVLLLMDEPPDLSRQSASLPAAVRGFLSVQTSTDQLVHAVTALAAGLFVIEPAWTNLLTRPTSDIFNPEDSPGMVLSPREVEVLQQLALGLANKQIGVLFSLSENTIKYHISSIYSKLGASNRAEAVRIGARLGYISL